MIIPQELTTKTTRGMVIPKPYAKAAFNVKGWGKRRGEEALILEIPNPKNPGKPYQKGVTVSKWQRVYRRVCAGEDF